MEGWAAHADESGSEPGARGEPGRLVLACVAGSPAATAEPAGKTRNPRRGPFPDKDPAGWELHAAGMFHNLANPPLGSIGRGAQTAIMQKIVDIVCGSDVVLFTAVVPVARKGKRHSKARAARHAMGILACQMEQFAGRKGDVAFHMVSDHAHERHRLAIKGALGRQEPGRHVKSRAGKGVTGIEFVDSRSSEATQAVDGVACATSRRAGGDALFGGMPVDIGRKAGSHGV